MNEYEHEEAHEEAPEPKTKPRKKTQTPFAVVLAGINKAAELEYVSRGILKILAESYGVKEDVAEVAAAIVTNGKNTSLAHVRDIDALASSDPMDSMALAVAMFEDKARFRSAWSLIMTGRVPNHPVEAPLKLAKAAKALSAAELEELRTPLRYID